jgi:two-component system, LytTR family, response regulator
MRFGPVLGGGGMIRALIVDDEPLSRRKIREFLRDDSEIQIVGECGNGVEAVSAVRESAPDLLFLDVQMPGMDGFAVLQQLQSDRLPFVIFVTAYDKYAVQAFEVRALDYLLKPFHRERFARATDRAKAQIRADGADLAGRIRDLIQELRPQVRFLERVLIRNAGTVFFLKADEIDWISAEENYVRLHCGKTSYLLREKIGSLEGQLDSNRFRRIHRSTIVNLDRVDRLHNASHGDYHVMLKDGTELVLSRAYRERLAGRGV